MIKHYKNLSLYHKIIWIMSITILLIYSTFFLSIRYLTLQYEKELYEANAQALNHVSANISSKLQIIESIADDIVSDNIIQENLIYLENYPYGNRRADARRNIYLSLYPHTFSDNYIKSIHIIPNDEIDICMGNSNYIENYNINEIDIEVNSARGRFIFKTPTNVDGTVIGARIIRQLKYLNLQKMASIYVVVDMERMIHDTLQSTGYDPEHSKFVLRLNETRIYPENSFYDEAFHDLITEMKSNGDSYTITSIDHKKEFIISGSFSYSGWDYLYFRDYAPIFQNIQLTKLKVWIFSFCFALISIVFVYLLIGRIFKHLNYLIEKIKRFGNGETPPVDDFQYDYSLRNDEIGQLHKSFDEMTTRVKVLKDENYDKQLLLRDATIKMLQQQINPHFLYNTLDTINWLSQKYGANDISIMVRSLGNLFRSTVTVQKELVPLKDELYFLDNYMKIQWIRFEDRLNFTLETPKDTNDIFVPPLCIQPLVENAINHAISYTDEICDIHVSILENQLHYQIKVTNTGSQFEDDLLWKIEHKEIKPQGSGVGLGNIDSRLKLLYGDQYGLTFSNSENIACVMMLIPKERK